MARLGTDELYRRALEVGFWFHSVPLGNGLYTPGHKTLDQMQGEAVRWQFPADLTGKSVLDIGCADGGWSILALERGAKSVLAIDEQMTVGLRFLVENEVYPFEYRQMDLFSDSFLTLATFDFVIFTGVLYHVKNPLEALVRLRHVTGERALIETHINEASGSDIPLMVFYEHGELGGDLTNWWGPNRRCLEAMLRVAGFEAVDVTDTIFSGPLMENGRVSCLAYPSTSAAPAPLGQVQTTLG